MKTTVNIIVENTTVSPDLKAEHGLSYLIEHDGQKILFDTGQGNALPHNLTQLNLNLKNLSAIVLSHGHYDHTGGLEFALSQAPQTPVYLHPDALLPKYTHKSDNTLKPLTPPYILELPQKNYHLCYITQPTYLSDNILITGPIPRTNNFEDTGGPFFSDSTLQTPDPLIDDQSLVLKTPEGLIVILGCAHAGIINTLDYIRTLTDNHPIHTVMGGTHLIHASQHRIDQTLQRLDSYHLHQIIPLHCTGTQAVSQIEKHFPKQFKRLSAGSTLTL